jgi:hypothetical protein
VVNPVGLGLVQVNPSTSVEAGTYVASFYGTGGIRLYNVGATPPAFGASGSTFTLDGTADVAVELQAGGSYSDVQFELGTVATVYEWRGLHEEIVACQRYYIRLTSSGAYTHLATGLQASTTQFEVIVPLVAPMRAVPSVAMVGLEISDASTFGAAATAVTQVRLSPTNINIFGINNAGGAAVRPTFLRSGATWPASYLEMSADI